jgi:hypothetical protein
MYILLQVVTLSVLLLQLTDECQHLQACGYVFHVFSPRAQRIIQF